VAFDLVKCLGCLNIKGKNIIASKTCGQIWMDRAFVAPIIPFSENFIYTTLGLTKYNPNPEKFAVSVFAGVFLYNEFIVWLGVLLGRPFVQNIISQFTVTSNPTAIIIAIILSITGVLVTLFLLIKINWNKIIGKRFPWTRTDNTDE
jgi:hypothetical protein